MSAPISVYTGGKPARVYLLAGEPVLLLAANFGPGAPRQCLLETPDGHRFTRPFRGLRRLYLRERLTPA